LDTTPAGGAEDTSPVRVLAKRVDELQRKAPPAATVAAGPHASGRDSRAGAEPATQEELGQVEAGGPQAPAQNRDFLRCPRLFWSDEMARAARRVPFLGPKKSRAPQKVEILCKGPF